MSSDRGAEIERFFFLILNLLGKAFGYLLVIVGVLFVLSFLSEAFFNDGVMNWNGKQLHGWSQQWPLIVSGLLVAALGLLLVKVLPIGLKKSEESVGQS